MVRLAADISQRELAVQARVSQDLISKLENGHSDPSFRVLSRLVQVLDAEPGELFPDIYAREDEQ